MIVLVWWPWCAEGDEGMRACRRSGYQRAAQSLVTRPRWAREPDKQLSWRPGMGMKHALSALRRQHEGWNVARGYGGDRRVSRQEHGWRVCPAVRRHGAQEVRRYTRAEPAKERACVGCVPGRTVENIRTSSVIGSEAFQHCFF